MSTHKTHIRAQKLLDSSLYPTIFVRQAASGGFFHRIDPPCSNRSPKPGDQSLALFGLRFVRCVSRSKEGICWQINCTRDLDCTFHLNKVR